MLRYGNFIKFIINYVVRVSQNKSTGASVPQDHSRPVEAPGRSINAPYFIDVIFIFNCINEKVLLPSSRNEFGTGTEVTKKREPETNCSAGFGTRCAKGVGILLRFPSFGGQVY